MHIFFFSPYPLPCLPPSLKIIIISMGLCGMSCHSCEGDISGTPWGQRSTLLWHHHVTKRQSCKLQLDWLTGSLQSWVSNCSSPLLWFTSTPFVSSCACYRPNNQNAIAMETQSSHTFPLFMLRLYPSLHTVHSYQDKVMFVWFQSISTQVCNTAEASSTSVLICSVTIIKHSHRKSSLWICIHLFSSFF